MELAHGIGKLASLKLAGWRAREELQFKSEGSLLLEFLLLPEMSFFPVRAYLNG